MQFLFVDLLVKHLLSGTAPLGVAGESPTLLTQLANVATAAEPSGAALSQPNPAGGSGNSDLPTLPSLLIGVNPRGDPPTLPSLPIADNPPQPSPPHNLSPTPSKDKRSDATPLSSSKKAKLTKKINVFARLSYSCNVWSFQRPGCPFVL